MSLVCHCREIHRPRRIVLTGGPDAGKTLIIELARRSLCHHVRVVPEASGILFRGGFPTGESQRQRRATQCAIYQVQRQMETVAEDENPALLLCDRGTLDGLAYWPGPREDLWHAVGSSLEDELARYDAVIHLHTPVASPYDRFDDARELTPEDAEEIDDRILRAWGGHPHRLILDQQLDALERARQVMHFLRDELPTCCGGAWQANLARPESASASAWGQPPH